MRPIPVLHTLETPVTELNTAEDLVGTAVQQLVGSPGSSRVRTQIDYSRPALVGTFDFVHSLRILTNLLDNAMRYAPGDDHPARRGCPSRRR